MSVRWHCDLCGQHGHIHPKTEPLFDEKEVEVDTHEVTGHEDRAIERHETYMDEQEVKGADGSVTKVPVARTRKVATVVKVPIVNTVRKVVTQRTPRTVRMRRQNIHTGAMEEFETHEHKDLDHRSFVVTLTFGLEEVTRHLCRGCLNKLMPVLRPAWDALEKLK